LPEKCGEPKKANSCGCFDGKTFELVDGIYACRNGCLVKGGGGVGGEGGSGGVGGAGWNCENVPVAQLCVRGEIDAANNQEVLKEGGVVRFQLTPKGCFSSSCTVVHEASCTIMAVAPGAFELTGTFCLEDTASQQQGCTPDCGGGGYASCEQSGIAAGSYTASINGLQVSFDVPQTMPFGGICVGSPF
jgi:hypothetical protein